MKKENKYILVFVFILGVLIFSLVIHLLENRPSLDIHNLDPRKVKSIKVYDRGLLGNDSLILHGKEEILNIAKVIVGSSRIEHHDVSFKENKGLCEIELSTENENVIVTMTNTIKTDGILRSGEYCYRNDKILEIIMAKLREKK